jgi:hypothetical protein
MNKIAASIGIVALGTTVIQAVESSALNSMQSTKPWSIAASLRGFYDSNIDTTDNGQESLGYQLEPSFDFGLAGEQTSVNVGYSLSANYFEKKPISEDGKWSYTHMFEGALSHTFSPRLDMSVNESFALGREPDIRRSAGGSSDSFTRTSGDNLRNSAGIGFRAEMTQTLGLDFGYNNNLVDYDEEGAGSLSALLDRMEHAFRLDSNWKVRPETTGIIGYTYGQTLYTADETLIGTRKSDERDQRRHRVYVGARHAFTPTLSALLKVGGEYVDHYNDASADSTIRPYVEGTVNYAYQTTTTFELGFSYENSPSSTVGATTASLVQDTDSAVLYGKLSHEIVRHLVGSVTVTGQHSTFNGGSLDGDTQTFYSANLRLAYQFTPNLSAHTSYNFDNLDSDAPGYGYDRSRIFLGVTASY